VCHALHLRNPPRHAGPVSSALSRSADQTVHGAGDKRLAEAILSKVNVQIIEGRFFAKQESQERSLAELMDRYASEYAARRTVIVFRSKNGERRTIPINSLVLDLLKHKYAARSRMTDVVFLSQTGTSLGGSSIRRGLNAALPLAKIQDFHFHDLRHTFALRNVQVGVDLYNVQRLLGHKSPIMTQRYAHHHS
jgi:hypothetical protein